MPAAVTLPPKAKAWPSTEVLLALATLAPEAGKRITAADLMRAMPHLSVDQRNNGTKKLGSLGYLQHRVVTVNGVATGSWVITDDGMSAIAAAQLGQRIISGSRRPRDHRPGSLPTRVWALLRIRKVLDADSAARLLCDAGDVNFTIVRNKVGVALARWAADGVVTQSQQTLATGYGGKPRKRYVLVNDPGPVAPPWQPRKAAGQGAGA